MPPVNPGPTMSERVASLESQITDTQMALVENYEQTDASNTDLLMATAEVYENLLALQERVSALEGGGTNG